MTGRRADWQVIQPLGKGGQSEVFLVRNPARSAERARCLEEIRPAIDGDKRAELAAAIWSYSRPDLPSELGALKVFNPRAAGPEGEQHALDRLRSEIAVLSQKKPGLLTLLDSNESERWIVTEYCPGRTLEYHSVKYAGNTGLALTAFRSLVETVARLHGENIIHRDIKPANVFIGDDGRLILGDFGIAFLPNLPERFTLTNESVGPHDYIPPWADKEERLEKIGANFDVYMLGKLLWCMIAGRLKLTREWHRKPDFDLTLKFQDYPHMYMINAILDKCLVEDPANCLPSAQELLMVVDAHLSVIHRGGQLLSENVPRPCRVCGQGFYRTPADSWGQPNQALVIPAGSFSVPGNYPASWRQEGALYLQPFVCEVCGHIEFFKKAPR